MTDKEKTSLKAEIASIFDKFNILEHTATIGGLRDDILRLIDSAQDKPKFNIGDVITNGGRSVTITDITEDSYIVTNDEIENDANCVNWHIKIKDQDKWMLVENARPKFNVGDWIISEEAHKDYRICKITRIQDGCYSIESIYGFKGWNYFSVFEEIYRVWTIKDAQPGDILANDHHILILRELGYSWASDGNPDSLYAYCGIKPNGNFELEQEGYCFCGPLHTHPATKEQRDSLFSKMENAGYRWDANKRELKESFRRPEDNNSDDDLDKAVMNYMLQFSGNNFCKAPWAIDSTGMAMPKALAKFGADWQKEKDKIWLAENHKQIFNNGYEEGFESGRDDAYDEITKKSFKRTVEMDAHGFACVNIPNVQYGKIVNVAILEDD